MLKTEAADTKWYSSITTIEETYRAISVKSRWTIQTLSNNGMIMSAAIQLQKIPLQCLSYKQVFVLDWILAGCIDHHQQTRRSPSPAKYWIFIRSFAIPACWPRTTLTLVSDKNIYGTRQADLLCWDCIELKGGLRAKSPSSISACCQYTWDSDSRPASAAADVGIGPQIPYFLFSMWTPHRRELTKMLSTAKSCPSSDSILREQRRFVQHSTS